MRLFCSHVLLWTLLACWPCRGLAAQENVSPEGTVPAEADKSERSRLSIPATKPAAQPPAASPAEWQPPTVEELDALAKRLDESTLEPDVLAAAREELQSARAKLAQAETYDQTAAQYEQAVAQTETAAAQLREQIESFEKKPPARINPDLPLEELEALAEQAKVALKTAEQEMKSAEEMVATMVTRRAKLDAELPALPAKQLEVETQLTQPTDLPPAAAAAREAYYRATLFDLKAVEPPYRAELDYYVAREKVQLTNLQKRKAQLQIAYTKDWIAALTAPIEQARERQRIAKEAEIKAAMRRYSPALQDAAAGVEALTEETSGIQRELETIAKQAETTESLLTEWEGKLPKLEARVKESGMTEIFGLELRELKSRLPELVTIWARRANREGRARDLQRRQFHLRSQIIELQNTEAAVNELLQSLGRDVVIDESLREQATRLIEQRRDTLSELEKAYVTYFRDLTDLDKRDKQVVDTVSELDDFISGWMLWSRSHPSMLDTSLPAETWSLGERANWFLRPASWTYVLKRFSRDIAQQPILYIAAAAFAVILILGRQWLRFRIRRVAEQGRRRANTSFQPFVRTFAMTIADSAVWPGVLYFLASRVGAVFDDDPGIAPTAAELQRIAFGLFLIDFIHDACLPGGLAELLGLRPEVTKYVRKKTFQLELFGVPLAILVVLLHVDNVALAMRATERICFVIGMLVLTRFAHEMLRRSSPLVATNREEAEEGVALPLWKRFRVFVWTTAVSVPLGIAALSIVGYHNTAVQLLGKLELTVWLGVGLVLLRRVLLTIIGLRQRHLRFEKIRQEVEERIAAQQADASSEEAAPPDATTSGAAQLGVQVEDEDTSESLMARLSGQSERLLGTLTGIAFLFGVYSIWTDVLPALDPLRQWTVYHVDGVVEIDGETKEAKVPITVGGLLFAAVAVMLTVTAARNLPGVIEFSVLERVGLDRSVRYAITTILSYLIALFGAIVAANLLGLTWSSVQWLAAGLTVGLGFGLQEIFANFISGLIIFVEQPVRVGDIVTLDGVTGVVSKIRIRATTIVNWDRKEYIVPNKEFITGRLLNWTLSDTTNRLVLTVGVAYGTDTDKAKAMLEDILASTDEVLKDPGPLVTLEELGDSSLNFTIRCYLPTLDNRLGVTDKLYSRIHREFNAADIEIPFPQRDLNVRGWPTLESRSEAT